MLHSKQSIALLVIGASLIVVTSACISLHGYTAIGESSPSADATATMSESAELHGVTLTVECPGTLVSGDENYVTMTVRNEGEATVQFYPVKKPFRGPPFQVSSRGEAVSPTALGKNHLVEHAVMKATRPIQIKKGHELRVVVNLTRYYDLSLPGQYRLVVTWIGNRIGREEPIRIQTPPLEFEVRVEPGESVSAP